MRKIVFVTGNEYKFQVAVEALKPYGIELEQIRLETPEIQSTKVEDVAGFSAKWVSEKLDRPAVLTDAGYYIQALCGFPGPFIKWVNSWLTAENYVKLMEGKVDRKIVVKECLAYCEPGKEPVVFVGEFVGQMAEKVGAKGTTPINEVFIPEGFDRVESEISREEMVKFWGTSGNWQKLGEYLKI
ncbi:hypothetical protein A2368_02120 [Candidatus Collierbacteria bacterium RIFOXYB1_FULL_49_13]|uniref:Non-canonical purine NTP pyrophosphatase n=1 Tax=Candidatus Collierbacteria bacterium RIFOXYB1_FULL_49_13 TaxID=1817728 RepID=A0A1F5FGE6_9BACT|nr:MAG: hypothetical protein A2368_02120 [Candidatus Collierbacteria bacterium RIFOXYB1_FULL_49_13]